MDIKTERHKVNRMSNDIINIRFGCKHFQVTRNFKITFRYNPWHEDNPNRFEVYKFLWYNK